MFNYTLLLIAPTCFGHSCDHPQNVVQQEYKQYNSEYTETERENPARLSAIFSKGEGEFRSRRRHESPDGE